MTIDEAKQVIRKIKTFRPFFQTGNGSREESEFLKEWYKVLEPYEFADVEQKLMEYFKDGENIGKIPDVFYITKHLKSHAEKRCAQGLWIRCPWCQEEVASPLFEEHYDRCLSVTFICKNAKTKFNQVVDPKKLISLPKEEFDKKYLIFIEKLIGKVTDIEEKDRLMRIAKVLKGEKITITLKDVM